MEARQQYEANKSEAKKKEDERRPIPIWWLGQRDPIARFTLYVAAFTFALAAFTFALFGVGVVQFKILKQTDERVDCATGLLLALMDLRFVLKKRGIRFLDGE